LASAEDRALNITPHFNPGRLKALMLITLPLGITMALLSLMVNVQNYFIVLKNELGIFTGLAYLTLAGNTVIAALGQSATPRLAHYYAGGNRRLFLRLLGILLVAGALIGAGGVVISMIAGRQLLTIVYTSEYASYNVEFTWLMVGAGIGYLAAFLGNAMTAARYFRVQVPLYIVVTLVTIATCYWLVPSYHLMGIAVALIIVAVVETVGSLVIVIHALRAVNTDEPLLNGIEPTNN
jgi:O-antigen/teichoic acid export membrane protein